jgi:hypothetical protein
MNNQIYKKYLTMKSLAFAKTIKTVLASLVMSPLMVNSTVIGLSTLVIMEVTTPHQAMAQRTVTSRMIISSYQSFKTT